MGSFNICLLATDFLATDFLATDFLATDFLATDFLATDFLATDFLATDFLATDLSKNFLATPLFNLIFKINLCIWNSTKYFPKEKI